MMLHAVYSAARCSTCYSCKPCARCAAVDSDSRTRHRAEGGPAQLVCVGGEGIRLRGARWVKLGLGVYDSQIVQFFARLFRTAFFVASVVAPPEGLIYETTPSMRMYRHGN